MPEEEWKKWLIMELDRQNECIKELYNENKTSDRKLAKLEVKSGVWGFAAGLLPALAVLIWWIIKTAK